MNIEWTDKCLNILTNIVELDLIRYSGNGDYADLLKLHKTKFDWAIKRNKFKTQIEFENELILYKKFFEDISIKGNLVY
jgi:hypothetical protein